MKRYYVMDIGGTLVKYALMNEDLAILEQGSFPAVTDSLEQFLASLDAAISQYRGQYEGIAISMPGRIDTVKGIAHTGGAFEFFHDTALGKILEECYLVPVTLANDGKCAAKAETASGALKDVDSGAVIVIGTAVGGAIVLDHKVYLGSQSAAGEFSYLVEDYRRFMKESPSDPDYEMATWANCFSTRSLIRNYAERKGTDPKDCDGIRFFEAYDHNDEDAVELLDDFGAMAAAGIFTVQAVLDLERFAIGGGISARKEVIETIRKHLKWCYDIPNIPFRFPEIVPCRYGNDANLIGALSFHLDRQ